MIRRLALITAIALSAFVLAPGPRPARAQAPDCSSQGFPAPPSGWRVITGSLTGSNILSGTGTPIGGGSEALIDVNFSGFSNPKYIYSVTFTWYGLPSVDQSVGRVTTILSAAASGHPGDTNQESDNVLSTTFLSWQTTTFYFTGQPADQIELTIANPLSSAFITLGMVRICTTDAIPLTPTGTSTPSTTPSPTSGPTSTATSTPTPTFTPSPSDTPGSVGGMTVTPSLTPILASTLVGGQTMSVDSKMFATVEGPKQCKDAFNPCGALPFPVPPMATINLPSPTALPVTPFITPGAFGTPTGTVTIAPTVLTTDQAALVQFATNAQGAAQVVAVTTPGLTGPTGSGPGGLADAANSANQIGAYVGNAFGIVRSVQGFFIGKTGAVILFLLLVVLFIVLIRLIVFAIPIIIGFFRLVVQVIGAIL